MVSEEERDLNEYRPEMGFIRVGEVCPDCNVPMHYKKGQGIIFCWECIADRENAKRGKALLERMKQKDKVVPSDDSIL